MKFIMKKLGKILIIIILLIMYIYVASICLIPDHIIVFEGENIKIPTLFGINVSQNNNKNDYIFSNTIQTVTNLDTKKLDEIGKINLSLNLFNKIPLKQIDVDIIKKTKVVPLGDAIGLKLYTKGVLVVGMSEIKGENEVSYKPYQDSGIKEGDMIIEINNNKINNTEDLIKNVNSSDGNKIDIKYLREEETCNTSIIPVKTENNEYKIGLWVRDAQAGVGTATFYEKETKKFCALGHAITVIDTGEIVNIANGELVSTNIVSITKGKKGSPGQIKGVIDGSKTLGDIQKNTPFGLYGKISEYNDITSGEDEIEVALRDEIQEGNAEIICELEDGKKEKYNIKIEKIFLGNSSDNKSMKIKIVDDKLIQKTGGIIQGMSGSPIIQNGKFVGAVTHVLVQSPTEGYAVFADMLIKQMNEI